MKKIWFLLPLCLLTAFGLFACTPAENNKPVDSSADEKEEDVGAPEAVPVTLTENGVSEYRIVIAADATAPFKNAANELQKYIKLSTGAELPIVTDAEPAQDKEIVLGQTNRGTFNVNYDNLGVEGYCIRQWGETLVIAGAKRGVIYGVYGFATKILNVAFYPEGIEKVPENKTVVIEPTLKIVDAPVFASRTVYWGFYDDASDADRMKLGMTPTSAEWGGGDNVAANGFDMHTINYLLNNNESASLHTYCKQPCVSSDENYNKILQTALAWIERRNGACTYINISQNDGGGGWCTCDLCTQYNNEYGNGLPTGAWWYFINRITKDIHAVYPDVEIRTYAYEDTAPLPTLDIDPTVCAYVSTGNGGVCSNHGIEECEANKEALKESDLRVWSQKVSKIYVFDYYGCSGEYNMTFDNLYAMKSNYQVFAECGVYGVVPFGTTKVAADFVVLRYYLMTKLMWNPNVSDEEYQAWIDDFCAVYYGEESGKYIVDFIKLFHETFKDKDLKVSYGYNIAKVYALPVIEKTEDYIYPENGLELVETNNMAELLDINRILDTDYLKQAKDLFAKAQAVATDDVTAKRVKLASLQVDYHEVYLFNNNLKRMNNYLTEFNKRFGTSLTVTSVVYLQYCALNQTLIDNLIDCGVGRCSEKFDFNEGEADCSLLPSSWK